MAQLYHFPLSAPSRFIRLIMGELAMEAKLIEELAELRRRDFLVLNPAGTLPVLIEHDGQVVPEAATIAEYLDETRGLVLGERRLLPEAPALRVEVRRLVSWFATKFNAEVTAHLLAEKVMKRLVPRDGADSAPDTNAIRVARVNIRYHLKYVGHLVERRNWIAGERLTYADLAAAAEFSVVDYLGDVPWSEDDAAREWYARIKSRPSFRPLLADRLRGIPPAAHYADLDF